MAVTKTTVAARDRRGGRGGGGGRGVDVEAVRFALRSCPPGRRGAGGASGRRSVSDPMWTSTRAITVSAPPGAVWPWIVQMGFPAYRAGWYTPYWLDRLQWGITHRSADQIRPEFQNLALGDRVPDSADWSVFFTAEVVEPGRALVLLSTRHLLRPLRSINFSWAFVLDPVEEGATRLSMRARTRYQPRWAGVAIGPLIGVGDFLNASAMLRGIKQRAETAQSAPSARGSAKPKRRIGRGLADIAMAAPLFVGAPLARRRHLRWGASDIEVGGEMPGDEIVSQTASAPPGRSRSTCRRTGAAVDRPDRVWTRRVLQLRPAELGDRAPPRSCRIPGSKGRRLGAHGQDNLRSHCLQDRWLRGRSVDALGKAAQHLGMETHAAGR